MPLKRIDRRARRQVLKADRQYALPKRLVTHHRPRKEIVASRERYAHNLLDDEFAKWQKRQ